MSITPDQFLTQPSDPDDDSEGPQAFSTDWAVGKVWEIKPDHLGSIAKSLDTIAASFGANAELEDERNTLREEVADLHDKYAALFGLVADIEKVVAKSTSKLALSVKDAITLWKTGTVVEAEPFDAEAYVAEVAAATLVEPGRDAPVEEWRSYAERFELPEGLNLEQMNRSQIRSVLGMSQTAEPSDG